MTLIVVVNIANLIEFDWICSQLGGTSLGPRDINWKRKPSPEWATPAGRGLRGKQGCLLVCLSLLLAGTLSVSDIRM